MTQRADPFKAKRSGRVIQPLDPAQTLREHGVHGSHEATNTSQPAVVSSRRLQTISIAQIRPGRFQKRETVDPDKFQQLKDQISELGFNFVAILFIDQDDPNYFNPAMGGHLRIQAAKELGITEILALVREYDNVALAKGTYMENQARQQLSILEEGLVFQECQETLGWTQEEIAKKLIVPGGRGHVAVCMLTVTAAPDLKEMLRKASRRGLRAFYYFRQLDELGQERAMELRAPHIEAFLLSKISTDEVRLIVKQILDKEQGQDPEPISLEQVRREHKLTSSITSLQRFERDLGTGQPSEAEREALRKLKGKIDEILERE